MKSKFYRIIVTVITILLGVGMVFGIAFLGKRGVGPIDNLLGNLGSGISYIEDKLILNKREQSRSRHLQWFNEAELKSGNLPKMLYGAYDDQVSETYQNIVDLEDSLRTVFPIIQLYVAWGSKAEQQFPKNRVRAISQIGSVPLITWEPWLSDFNEKDYPNIPEKHKRDKNQLKSIAGGTYDKYVQDWAIAAKEAAVPMFVRLGHEMNDPYRYPWGPQNNHPNDFIEAWRHVVDQFKAVGATNVIWIWSPHLAYGDYDLYYPGDEYVDWVGVGALNYGTVASWSNWYTFKEIFGKHYEEMSKYNRPIMISEFGSLATGGDREKWYKDALTSLDVKYPLVKSVVFFHVASDATTTDKALNWYIKYDPDIVRTVARIINNEDKPDK